MIKNKDLNYALIVFAITLTLLFAFVTYFPSNDLAETDAKTVETEQTDNLAVTSN